MLKKGRAREVFERALLRTMNENEEIAMEVRKTAYRFSFIEELLMNLNSNNVNRRLRGCQQVGAYLYEPAVPLLLKMLHFTLPQLQYSVLLALANFGRPELIVEAFQIIEHAVLVNDRTVREIVYKMGDRKSELFGAILKGNSPVLVPLFLKFIDMDSANTYLFNIINLSKTDDMELRIAAVRALAQTKNQVVVPELIAALEAEEWEVRAAAAKGLQSVPHQDASFPLLQAMSDRAWWVRQNAALAALSLANPKKMIKKALLTNDPYALDSLYYAADILGMTEIVEEVKKKQKQNQSTENQPTKNQPIQNQLKDQDKHAIMTKVNALA